MWNNLYDDTDPIKEMEDIDEEYYEDEPYKEREEEGPYGGAFRDWNDYYSWREGPGFFR